MSRGKARRRGPSPAIRQRLTECRSRMRGAKLPALLITHRPDQIYLTGFSGEDGGVLITPREVYLLTDARFETSSGVEAPWARPIFRKQTLEQELEKLARRLRMRKVGIQAEHVSLAQCSAYRRAVRPARLVAAPDIAGSMRKRKSAEELALFRRAIRVAEEAFLRLLGTIRPGQTERQIAARLEYEMAMVGADRPAFETIVAEGANAALPHAFPGGRRVKRGSHVLLDWGARCGWYCSDLTRVVFVGRVPARMREVYQVVLEAQLAAMDAIRPGARMCDVDAVARGHIERAGYGEYFGHGLGHGLGLEVHEAPSLNWRSTEVLESGMVVTVEPGIYLPGVGGVRIEDDVVVTDRGCRVLSVLTTSLGALTI